jgi:hypothetical protein
MSLHRKTFDRQTVRQRAHYKTAVVSQLCRPKCRLDKHCIGQMSVSQMPVSQMSIGQMYVSQMSVS